MTMTVPIVLLVDDEVSFVETMAKRLDKRDMEILTATSGEESLKVLETHQNLDVVVLDVKMPGLDGLETLKRIKAAFPLIEVIMLTGYATIESGIRGMKLGAYDFLMKPCDIEELVSKITDATQKKREREDKIREAERKEMLLKYEP
jgi:DNA-binding NtrC family response regulator